MFLDIKKFDVIHNCKFEIRNSPYFWSRVVLTHFNFDLCFCKVYIDIFRRYWGHIFTVEWFNFVILSLACHINVKEIVFGAVQSESSFNSIDKGKKIAKNIFVFMYAEKKDSLNVWIFSISQKTVKKTDKKWVWIC